MLARKINYYEEHEYTGYEKIDAQEQIRPYTRPVCNTSLRRQVATLVLVVLSFAFLMVMRSDVYIQKSYELGALQREEAVVVKNNEHLQVRMAALKAPERITTLARGLGMVNADKNMYVSAAAGKTAPVAPDVDKTRTAMKKD